jgi:hypothetical protein
MRARRRPILTYANVVSTLCLFIVLGGGAYAAATINGADLKARSVPATKIRRDALTGAEIRESTLRRVPDAARLAGSAPSAFLRASRVASGLGNVTSTVPDTLITSPTIGLKVTTDGDADATQTLRFINQGGDRIIVSRSSVGSFSAIEPGAAGSFDSTPGVETFVVRSEKAQARAVTMICGFESFTNTVDCTALATF